MGSCLGHFFGVFLGYNMGYIRYIPNIPQDIRVSSGRGPRLQRILVVGIILVRPSEVFLCRRIQQSEP